MLLYRIRSSLSGRKAEALLRSHGIEVEFKSWDEDELTKYYLADPVLETPVGTFRGLHEIQGNFLNKPIAAKFRGDVGRPAVTVRKGRQTKATIEGSYARNGHPAIAKSIAWYRSHRKDLLKDYPGQYVAIVDDQVVDHGDQFQPLVERAFRRFGVRDILIRKVVPEGAEKVVKISTPMKIGR